MRRALTTTRSITPADNLVGQKVRIFRIAHGLTQAELAQAIGVTFQQVQKYENGANRIGSARLARIADTLGVPVARFFEDSETLAAADVAGPVGTDLLAGLYAVPMLQAFSKIPSADMRYALVKLTEQVVEKRKRRLPGAQR